MSNIGKTLFEANDTIDSNTYFTLNSKTYKVIRKKVLGTTNGVRATEHPECTSRKIIIGNDLKISTIIETPTN